MSLVSKIQIELEGGQVLLLTHDEAKQLRDCLDSFLGRPPPVYWPYPCYVPQPIYIERWANPWYGDNTYTYATDGTDLTNDFIIESNITI